MGISAASMSARVRRIDRGRLAPNGTARGRRQPMSFLFKRLFAGIIRPESPLDTTSCAEDLEEGEGAEGSGAAKETPEPEPPVYAELWFWPRWMPPQRFAIIRE